MVYALTTPNAGVRNANDPLLSKSWHLDTIHAKKAWNIATGSYNTTFCVIDSGVDVSHPDLKANIRADVYDATQCKYQNADFNGHGTHCSGIIGASGNNGIGSSGLMWRSNLLACKFLDSDGTGYVSDAMSCLDWCAERGAQIVSMSWGIYSYSKVLKDKLQSLAAENDILFVAAAGNEGMNNDGSSSMFPAGYDLDALISVAATDQSNKLAKFSNYGRKRTHIGAPGVSIFSTLPGNQYGYMSGSSMSAPLVAATLGLMADASGNTLSGLQLKSILLESARRTRVLQGLVSSGRLLDSGEAVLAAKALAKCQTSK